MREDRVARAGLVTGARAPTGAPSDYPGLPPVSGTVVGRSNLPSPMRSAEPSPDAAVRTDLLWGAQTHEAVADSLSDKAQRLDPTGTLPALRLLRRMVRDHRIKAILLRGQAAVANGIAPGTK